VREVGYRGGITILRDYVRASGSPSCASEHHGVEVLSVIALLDRPLAENAVRLPAASGAAKEDLFQGAIN
jgi:hypothetical protein